MREFKRYLAIDDSFFSKPGKCLLVSVIYDAKVTGIGIHELWTDPGDLTHLLKSILNLHNIDLVFVDGITVCGFGIWRLDRIDKPAIAILKKVPALYRAKNVILRMYGPEIWEFVINFIKRLELVEINKRRFYVARYGITKEEGLRVLTKLSKYSYFPEPLRLADLIAHEMGSRFIKGTRGDP